MIFFLDIGTRNFCVVPNSNKDGDPQHMIFNFVVVGWSNE